MRDKSFVEENIDRTKELLHSSSQKILSRPVFHVTVKAAYQVDKGCYFKDVNNIHHKDLELSIVVGKRHNEEGDNERGLFIYSQIKQALSIYKPVSASVPVNDECVEKVSNVIEVSLKFLKERLTNFTNNDILQTQLNNEDDECIIYNYLQIDGSIDLRIHFTVSAIHENYLV